MTVANISDAFSDILLKSWLHRDITDLPTSYFVGLLLELPTDQNGSDLVEPNNTEYVRLETSANSSDWVSIAALPRLLALDPELLYPEAVTDWGLVRGYCLFDSLTAGMYLGYGETNEFNVVSGLRARVPSQAIVISQPVFSGGEGGPFWYDLSFDASFPPEAPIGAYGFDFTNGNVWRNA